MAIVAVGFFAPNDGANICGSRQRPWGSLDHTAYERTKRKIHSLDLNELRVERDSRLPAGSIIARVFPKQPE